MIGYAIFGLFEGYEPIFALGPLSWTVWQIPLFLLLGVLCAAFGLLFIFVYYWHATGLLPCSKGIIFPSI